MCIALDMSPYGNENSHHIEFDRRENISILRSKNIEQTLVCISTKNEWHLNRSVFMNNVGFAVSDEPHSAHPKGCILR